jgi:hypothetical protein
MTAKTFLPNAPVRGRFPSPNASANKQDSLIFIGCIDFPWRDGEIDRPVMLEPDRGI